MNEIRILHVIPNLVKGGAQRIALDICNELETRPEVEVVLLYWEGENQFEFLSKNLEVHKINIQYELSFSGQHKINISEYEAFVDDFNKKIEGYRIVHNKDVVSSVPPKTFDYAHISLGICYNENNSEYVICEKDESCNITECSSNDHLNYLNMTMGSAGCDENQHLL